MRTILTKKLKKKTPQHRKKPAENIHIHTIKDFAVNCTSSTQLLLYSMWL